MTFLEETAGYLWKKYDDHIERVCIVLPNKRGGLYLKKYLSAIAGKTIWAPRILSIEELISEISGFYISDNFNLLFDLYAIHKNIDKEKTQSFEEFMNWGQTLLQDFNDVDNYLADAEHLYKYLDAARVMSVWNVDGRPLTDFQQKYLAFYKSLYIYYTDFRNLLIAKKQAYPGLASRYVAENLEQIIAAKPENSFVFAGFNAMTTAEETIIKYFINLDIAEIIWDTDKYYMDNQMQEAGTFLRKYRDEWKLKNFNIIGDHYHDKEKKITVIGVPKQVGQAKVCGEIISGMQKDDTNNTALVLADESLLMPILNSISPELKSFNITMGFPLSLSSIRSLFESIFHMHETVQRLSKMRPEQHELLYFEDVISILNHPYIISLTGNKIDGAVISSSGKVASTIRSHNMIFLSSSKIKKLFDDVDPGGWDLVKTLFVPWELKANNAFIAITALLEGLRDHFISEKEAVLEMEFVYQLACLNQRLKTLIAESNLEQNTKILRTLFDRLVKSTTLPFYGEPLSGFQLMGVLETRTLDFPNLIMTSVNDDIIPSGRMQQSFIPFDIRSQFHLPTYKEKEAIYAYHFYRLLQRSKNIWLIYNTESDNLGGGERSRFISQLIHELPKYNPDVVIEEKLFTLSPALNIPDTSISISKSEDILELMKMKARSGFSPSTLNAYLNCSLRFYFQELIGLREPDEVEETIDAANMGRAIHKVLQMLYEPYKNKELTEKAFEVMMSKVDELIPEVFAEMLEGGDFRYGKNLLIMKVATVYISNFLQQEAEYVSKLSETGQKLIIKNLEFPFHIKYNEGQIANCEVVLKGFADRIDSIGGSIRIIDYKTGRVNEKELILAGLDDLTAPAISREKSFQLAMYAFLYYKSNPGYKGSLESGIISFRSLSNGLMPVRIGDSKKVDVTLAMEFEGIIHEIVKVMFNKDISIEQTKEPGNCIYCPYRFICYKA